MESNPPSIRKNGPVIAIDGPAGTGKSSVTKRLAQVLGYVHVDTGALYRAVGVLAARKGWTSSSSVNLDEQEHIIALARTAHFEFTYSPDLNPSSRLIVNGEDLTNDLRTPEMSMMASFVSSIPGVRASLLGLQRTLGGKGRTILEGRDIGTVIFPDADVKFFLTATSEERTKRRLAELESQGKDPPSFQEVKTQIEARDHADRTRSTAPLKKSFDAIEVDTTHLTLDEVVQIMAARVQAKLAGPFE